MASKKHANDLQDESQKRGIKSNLSKGMKLLAVSAVVILLLLYALPVGMGIDIRGIMSSDAMLGILRILMGVLLLAYLFAGLARLVDSCRLEGESWGKGIQNAFRSMIIGRYGIGILLMASGGVALIVWGISYLVG